MTSQISRERLVHATPEAIFAVLTDIDQHGAIDGSGMVRGSARGPRPLVLGSRFTMGMHQGVEYRSGNTVVEYEPDRLIAWETKGSIGPVTIGGHRWRYELSPEVDGTRVTETLDWGTAPTWFAAPLARLGYFRRYEAAIEGTLTRLAAHVEAAG